MSIFDSALSLALTICSSFPHSSTGDLAVVQVDDPVGVFDYRRGVRCDEVFAVADAYDQRAALARSDYAAGLAAVDDGYGIGPDDLVRRLPHRLEQRAAVGLPDIVDELYEYLGVGLAAERVAVLG